MATVVVVKTAGIRHPSSAERLSPSKLGLGGISTKPTQVLVEVHRPASANCSAWDVFTHAAEEAVELGHVAFGLVPTPRQRASVLMLESNSEAASSARDTIYAAHTDGGLTPAYVMKPRVAGGFAPF